MAHVADVSARTVMERDGVDPVAISVFERQIDRLRRGERTLLSDAELEPYDSPPLPSPAGGAGVEALDGVAVIRLNGGMGTSMGMDRAKSLLAVSGQRRFLDLIVDQVVALRADTGARLPLTFLHSFRTSTDCLAALGEMLPIERPPVPLELLQNRVPRVLADSLEPVSWPADPELEWSPPGHGDLYPVLFATGLLDVLADEGYRSVFVANSDNLGAVADREMASWFESTGASFAVEAVRRTASDRKGGHFARRRRDGRLVLRETAQTPDDGVETIGKHRFASTNNLWFRVDAMREVLAAREGDLRLPMIANHKRVVPGDEATPAVIQLETAMGAAIECFDDATTVEVGRDRFVPVKTTDDLLVVRSDCYRVDDHHRLVQEAAVLPFVELSASYRHVGDLDERFPAGPPSLCEATSLVVEGDWTFGEDVRVVGDVTLGPEGGRVPDGAVLDGMRR